MSSTRCTVEAAVHKLCYTKEVTFKINFTALKVLRLFPLTAFFRPRLEALQLASTVHQRCGQGAAPFSPRRIVSQAFGERREKTRCGETQSLEIETGRHSAIVPTSRLLFHSLPAFATCRQLCHASWTRRVSSNRHTVADEADLPDRKTRTAVSFYQPIDFWLSPCGRYRTIRRHALRPLHGCDSSETTVDLLIGRNLNVMRPRSVKY